jgi:hypothetical protein
VYVYVSARARARTHTHTQTHTHILLRAERSMTSLLNLRMRLKVIWVQYVLSIIVRGHYCSSVHRINLEDYENGILQEAYRRCWLIPSCRVYLTVSKTVFFYWGGKLKGCGELGKKGSSLVGSSPEQFLAITAGTLAYICKYVGGARWLSG